MPAGGTKYYTYDAWNRLVEAKTGSVVTTFGYNAMHWQTTVEKGSETTHRYYSPGWQLLWESFDDSASPDWDAVHVWGKRGANEAVMRRVTDLADPVNPVVKDWFYIVDHLFSVRAVVDEIGRVWDRVSYSAYGEMAVRPAADINGDGILDNGDIGDFVAAFLAGDPSADFNFDGILDNGDIDGFVSLFSDYTASLGSQNPIGYAGYVRVNEIGEGGGWLARNRYLDPELGRWLTRDPAGYIDGLSLYLYVSGNPFGLVDPTGLAGWLSNLWNDAKTMHQAMMTDPVAVLGSYYGEVGSEVYDLGAGVVEGVASVGGGVIDVAKGDGDTTIAGQIAINMADNGVGNTLADMGGAALDAAGEHFDKVKAGDPEAIGDTFTAIGGILLPSGLLTKGGKLGKLAPDTPRTRLPQDINVNPRAPAQLDLNRPVGTSPTQNAAAQAEVRRMQDGGFTDIRVNQQQVNGNGVRVGINRPDVSGTNLRGIRENVEFDRSTSTRGKGHRDRALANDPDAIVRLITED